MYIVRIVDTLIGSPTLGQVLWAGIVDDYKPIFAAYDGRRDRLLAATWMEN